MLTYELGKKRGRPLYEQLYAAIKNDICLGKLQAWEKLPSKRDLARHLSVSVVTVENAYGQLVAEGYISAKAKRGYYVLPGDRIAPPQPPPASLPKPCQAKSDFLDLRSNSLSENDFPFSVWSKLMRKTMADYGKQVLQSTPAQGIEALRQSIAAHLYQFRGMEVHYDDIVVGAGAEYLYNLLIQLLGRHHCFGVENPGYPKIGQIYRANDVAYANLPMDEAGLSLQHLRRSPADVIHISPSHHYPTGIVMPGRRRQELLAWASEQPGRYIIEDDYDSEFRFCDKPIAAMISNDRQERVIYVNTFSKTISPAMRISYMILPPHLSRSFKQKLSFYSCTVPSLEQYTLAKFIQEGYFEQHINRMKNKYQSKRDAIIAAIRESDLHTQADILEQNAGLHFLLRIHTDKSDRELVRRAEEAGLLIACLSQYVHGNAEKYAHHIVVNYSSLDFDQIKPAVDKLAAVIRA
ncbi:MAG: PLP-dependent aminotransferase family protein [Firmicutes bacterium]|nr:PLP-dependent aminotransferase family protein [Bacillota bacterium]